MSIDYFESQLKRWLLDLRINHAGTLLSYGDYLALPDQDRSGDEQPVVDMKISKGIVELLGYDANNGEIDYNRATTRREHIPDYRIGVFDAGSRVRTVFPLEDKNTTVKFSDLIGTHSLQVARYMKALGTANALICNGRYVVGLALTKAGTTNPLFSLDLLALYEQLTNTGNPALLPIPVEPAIKSLYLRFCRESHVGTKPLLREIGLHPLAKWKQRARPISGHVENFIEDLNDQIALVAADAEAQLRGLLDAAGEAIQEIDVAVDGAAGPTVSARAHARNLSDGLLQGFSGLSIPSIQQRLSIVKANVLRLQSEPTNASYRASVERDLKELLEGRSSAHTVARRTAKEFLALCERMSNAKTAVELRYEKSLAVDSRFQGWYAMLEEALRLERSDEAIKEFALQAAYVYVVRLLLIRVCEDKELLKRRSLSNGGFRRLNTVLRAYLTFSSGTGASQLLSIAFENAQHIYSHFYGGQTFFDWYTPDDYLFLKTLHFLNRYDFEHVQQDILGQVYERYAKLHGDKDEGRFYTKRQIVDFMVDLSGMSRDNLVGKSMLDPACGSGTFLVAAAQHWIKAYKRGGRRKSAEIIEAAVHALWGIDINPFACYLAETNLLIQFLDLIKAARAEDRSYSGIPRFNIFNADSLADPDAHQSMLSSSSDDRIIDAMKRRTSFEDLDFTDGWEYVLANPPYGEVNDDLSRFRSASQNKNLYAAFIDFGLRMASDGGVMCYITPTTWLTQPKYLEARRTFLTRTRMRSIVKCPYDMFDRAFVDNVIFFVSAAPYNQGYYRDDVQCAQAPKRETEAWLSLSTINFTSIDSLRWQRDSELRFILREHVIDLLEHMRANGWVRLGQTYCMNGEVQRGIISPKAAALTAQPRGSNPLPYFVTSRAIGTFEAGGIRRYTLQSSPSYPFIDYTRSTVSEYRDPALFSGVRVLLRRGVSRQFRLQGALEMHADYVSNKDLYVAKPAQGLDPYALLGILNSKLVSYQIVNLSESAQKDDNTQISQDDVKNVLLPPLNPNDLGAIADLSKRIQKGASWLLRIKQYGFEIDVKTNELFVGHDLGNIAIKPDIKAFTAHHRSFSLLDAESAGLISVAGLTSFRITNFSQSGNVFTFSRGGQQTLLTCVSSSIAHYLELFFNGYREEVIGSTLDEVMRRAFIPKSDAGCDSVVHKVNRGIGRIRAVIAAVLQWDADLDDVVHGAAGLPAAVAANIAQFPDDL